MRTVTVNFIDVIEKVVPLLVIKAITRLPCTLANERKRVTLFIRLLILQIIFSLKSRLSGKDSCLGRFEICSDLMLFFAE